MDVQLLHLELTNARTKYVIVEGKNDKKALEQVGFIDVHELDRPLFEVVERVAVKEVVILTDFDAKGKELYGKLHHHLTRRGVKVDNRLRHLLLQTPLAHIEGLATFVENLR